jgi:hypothetical protein
LTQSCLTLKNFMSSRSLTWIDWSLACLLYIECLLLVFLFLFALLS